MKLELKHLAGYLPYGLKFKRQDYIYINTILGISFEDVVFELGKTPIKFIKPILRPLSDIMKVEFLYIWADETDFKSMAQCILLDNESFMSCKFSYYFWEELYKKKIDIQGLIEKGLAISIYDVEEAEI